MTKLQLIVEGGKATPNPQMAQTLGPMKIPLNEVLAKINEKTAALQGIKVPVTIDVNDKNKAYTISVGSPPTSELIKKELKLEKGSSTPNNQKIVNIAAEDVIKIAKMKMEGLLDRSLKAAVKTVAGTCNSMGILIEGKTSDKFNKDLEKGLYDQHLREERTQVSPERRTQLQAQLKNIQEELRKQLERLKAKEEKAQEAAPKVEAEAKPEETTDKKQPATADKKLPEKKEEKKPEKAKK